MMQPILLSALMLSPTTATNRHLYNHYYQQRMAANHNDPNRNRIRPSLSHHRLRAAEESSSAPNATTLTDTESEYDSSSTNDSTSLLMTSPWWNRIHEDYGTHSYNFIPESRRAASSVVFRFDRNRRRKLNESDTHVNGDDGADVDSSSHAVNMNDGMVNNTNPNMQSQNDSDANNATLQHWIGNHNDEPENTVHNSLNTTTVQSGSNNMTGIPMQTESHAQENNNTSNTTNNTNTNNNNTANTKPYKNSDSTTTQYEEYMIISGGYTDHDWKTFPVHAFPMTTSSLNQSHKGKWVDLSPLPSELLHNNTNSESWCNSRDNIEARERLYQQAKYLKNNDTTGTDPWLHADPCAPTGRMGHSSFMYQNYLYVFGGLIYDREQIPMSSRGNGAGTVREAFRLEDVPYVYRLDVGEMLEARQMMERKRKRRGVVQVGEDTVNRREEDIGLIEEIEELFLDDDYDDDDHSIAEETEIQAVLEEVHEVSNKKVKGWQRIIPRVKPFESLDGMPTMAASEVLLKSINRGENQGGMWNNNKYVMYGGLRIVLSDVAGPHASSKIINGGSHSSSAQKRSRIIELPLGDVWMYDIETDAFEKVTNSFGMPEGFNTQGDDSKMEKPSDNNNDDDGFWNRIDSSVFPRPRTAHAATVVGDDLVIHGGMGWDEHIDDWDGSTNWETLDDM